MKSRIILLTLLWLLPSLAPGQDQAASEVAAAPRDLDLEEHIEVVEMQIEALVRDADGRPVDGLNAEDFRVEVAGETAQILAVRRVGGPIVGSTGRSDARSSRGVEAAADSLSLILFVDLVHSNPATNARYLAQTLQFLDDELRRGDRVMVASYDGSVSVNLPFTDELKSVRTTLMGLLDRASTGLSAHTERRDIDLIQQLKSATNEDICLFADIYALGFAKEAHGEVVRTIAALEGFVDTLVGLPGRKALVHVSGGLPLVAGKGPMDYVIELCGGFEGTAGGVEGAIDFTSRADSVHADGDDLRMALLRFDTTPEWRRLAARANRNNVSFYPLHTEGLTDSTFSDAGSAARTTTTGTSAARGMNQQDALSLIAQETGGRAILNQNDASRALGLMAEDLRDYYLLSVRGTGGEAGEIHRVDVKVDRPGVRVRHRRSLHIQNRRQQVADRVLAAALHQATADNPMGLSAELAAGDPAAPDPTSGDLRNVRLKLRIPLSSLTLLPSGPEPSQTSLSGRFTVFLAATDVEGRTTPVRRSTVPVTVEPGDQSTELYTFEVEMQMRRGDHIIGFGVLDEIGGETSYLRTTVRG